MRQTRAIASPDVVHLVPIFSTFLWKGYTRYVYMTRYIDTCMYTIHRYRPTKETLLQKIALRLFSLSLNIHYDSKML
jgi:hypothetical protein